MTYDKEKYFNMLFSYLMYIGGNIQSNKQMRCPNGRAHANNDNVFSAHYYDTSKRGRPIVKCYSCGLNADIYDIAGVIHSTRDFIEQYKIIDKIFGSGEIEINEKYSKSESKSGTYSDEPVKYIPVQKKHASKIFSRKNIDVCRKKSKFEIIRDGEINGHWFYDNSENDIIAIDVRFELPNPSPGKKNKKTVQTFWYDGNQVRSYGRINIIYNLYYALSNPIRPILIHEGGKCAKIGHLSLKSFCNLSWNRGVDNADKPDWSVIKGRQVYILNDNDFPGMIAAYQLNDIFNKLNIESFILSRMIFWCNDCDLIREYSIDQGKRKECPSCNSENIDIEVNGIYKTFGIDDKGADIEDLLKSRISPEKIDEYIFSCEIKGV